MNRTYTRERVEQVVAELVGNPDCRTNGAAYDVGWDRCAREVLRRLDALPQSHPWPEPPLPPQPIHSAQPDGTFIPPLPAPRPPAELVGAEQHPIHSDPGVLIKATPIQRPRATTPVPEVPALKDEPHYRCADPDCEAPERPECGHVLTGRPPGSLRATCRKAPHGDDVPHRWDEEPGTMSPGPTAPEVVWTGDGGRVLSSGVFEWWTGEQWDNGRNAASISLLRITHHLARALAEVSSELREERANLHKIDRDRCDTINFLTREGVRERMKSHEDRLKLAESMRERVKTLIMAEQAKQEDGPLSDDNGHAFRLLLRLADAVGTLPLEEP